MEKDRVRVYKEREREVEAKQQLAEERERAVDARALEIEGRTRKSEMMVDEAVVKFRDVEERERVRVYIYIYILRIYIAYIHSKSARV